MMIVRMLIDMIKKCLEALNELPDDMWEPDEIEDFESLKGTIHDLVETLSYPSPTPLQPMSTGTKVDWSWDDAMLSHERRQGGDRRYQEVLEAAERALTDAEGIITARTGPSSWVGSLVLERVRRAINGDFKLDPQRDAIASNARQR